MKTAWVRAVPGIKQTLANGAKNYQGSGRMYSLKMSVGALVTLVVALLAVTELQAAPALPSSAGTIERTLPGQQGITAPPPAAEDIVAPTPVKESARPTNGTKITVSRFIVEGNTKLTEDEIAQLLGAAEGKALTLAEIYELADRLGAAYRDKGYRLATVTVPPQKIRAEASPAPSPPAITLHHLRADRAVCG